MVSLLRMADFCDHPLFQYWVWTHVPPVPLRLFFDPVDTTHPTILCGSVCRACCVCTLIVCALSQCGGKTHLFGSWHRLCVTLVQLLDLLAVQAKLFQESSELNFR